MKNPHLRVGFLTALDPMDKRSLSGCAYYMRRALEAHFEHVIPLGPAEPPRWLARTLDLADRLCSLLFRKNYISFFNLLLAWYYARVFDARIRAQQCDIIVAPMASQQIALLKTEKPIVYLSDATFHLLLDYYASFSNLVALSRWEGERMEQWAIGKAAALVYPSAWVKHSAIEHYGADPARVWVLPMGANLDWEPTREEVLKKELSPPYSLLFIGVDWNRKGGELAFQTLLELRSQGLPCHLNVVGCQPPCTHPDMSVIPFLNKNDPEVFERYKKLYLNAHFFFLPTRAEAFGIVFCEASSFGVPSITTDTGGVASAVENGVNGYRLPLDAGPQEYANLIGRLLRNETEYLQLCRNSRARYEAELNWEHWGMRMRTILEECH